MFGRTVNSRGLMAWTLAALLAPAAQFFGSLPWTWVLGAGGLAGVLALWQGRQRAEIPRPLAAAVVLVTVPALLLALRYSGACWPGVDDGIQGWALLAFGTWAALRGSRAGSRYGTVVLCLTALAYGLLVAWALPGVKGENLRPLTYGERPWTLLVLALPLLLRAFPQEGKGRSWPWILGGLLGGAALSAVCAGCLSPLRAAESTGAFYDLVRGLRLFGVAERFEAVVSGIMTMGWFCYVTLLLCAAGETGERIRKGGGEAALLLSAGMAAVLNLIV